MFGNDPTLCAGGADTCFEVELRGDRAVQQGNVIEYTEDCDLLPSEIDPRPMILLEGVMRRHGPAITSALCC